MNTPITFDNLPTQVSLNIEAIPSLNQLLTQASEVDLSLIDGIKSSSRQAEILASRQLLRHIYGPNTTLLHNPDGSPYLHNSPLHISISHCATHIAIASHPSLRIGIDIESWRQTLLRVKEKFLTPAEISIYNTPHLLLQAWTAKEAIYKAAAIPQLPLHAIILPQKPTLQSLPARQFTDNQTFATISTHPQLQFSLHTISTPLYTLTLAIPAN